MRCHLHYRIERLASADPRKALCGGISKVNFQETLSSFGDKYPKNGSKTAPTAPRPHLECPHKGPPVEEKATFHCRVLARTIAVHAQRSIEALSTGVPRSYETAPPQDPTVGLSRGPYGSPRGRAVSYVQDNPVSPQKALRGGVPGAVLEPLGRSWSHFVGIYRQKLTRSLGN